MKKQEEIKITTLIGKGSVLGGDFKVSGSCRVDGEIQGNVETTETLILGALGKIDGDIIAKRVLLAGEVNGNVDAPEKAELVCGAKVIGNIKTSVIVIDEKAIFQGSLDMAQAVPDKKVRAKVAKLDSKSAMAALSTALDELDVVVSKEENTEM